MYSEELGQLPLHGPFSGMPQNPAVTTQATSSSTSSGGWHPAVSTYTESTGVDQLSTPTPYSSPSSSSLHQSFSPQNDLLKEMISPTGDSPSDPVMNPIMHPMRGSGYPIPLQRSLQEPSPFNISPVTNRDTPFNVPPNRKIPPPPLHQQQGHQQQGHQQQGHQQLENQNTGTTGMPGIDLGTLNSDVMSILLNPSPGLL
jgi:hypothetical protein